MTQLVKAVLLRRGNHRELRTRREPRHHNHTDTQDTQDNPTKKSHPPLFLIFPYKKDSKKPMQETYTADGTRVRYSAHNINVADRGSLRVTPKYSGLPSPDNPGQRLIGHVLLRATLFVGAAYVGQIIWNEDLVGTVPGVRGIDSIWKFARLMMLLSILTTAWMKPWGKQRQESS